MPADDDEPISSRLIPGSDGWNIIFTKNGKEREQTYDDSLLLPVGRYFFWNPITSVKAWLPPDHLLKHLKESFTATRREMLFDPFCEEAIYLDESESDYESIEEDEPKVTKSVAETNADFKSLLMEREVDPFASWPSITESLKNEAAFLAVASDKKRQELLAECCPQLVALKRAQKEKEVAGAKAWFEEEMKKFKGTGVHWMDALRKFSADKRFALLNVKDCEKQYKSAK